MDRVRGTDPWRLTGVVVCNRAAIDRARISCVGFGAVEKAFESETQRDQSPHRPRPHLSSFVASEYSVEDDIRSHDTADTHRIGR